MRAAALQVLVAAMKRDEDLLLPDPRAVELAHRLVAPGPKACAVSASECHEIAHALLAIHDQQGPGSIGLLALYRHADALLDLATTWEKVSFAKTDEISFTKADEISFGEMLFLISRMDQKLAALHAVEASPADREVR